jgi:hypothetical protein
MRSVKLCVKVVMWDGVCVKHLLSVVSLLQNSDTILRNLSKADISLLTLALNECG